MGDHTNSFPFSALLESISREEFAIHLYGRQYHRDPFATVPFTPLYYVLDEVYFLKASPVCGKVLTLEPEEGYHSGCAFCMSRLILKVEDDDFILRLRDAKGDS